MALSSVKSKETDLLIVGAGINGAAAALDARLRGLDVCLIDKGDFGSGSSSGCFRIAHGGLRYLQHFDLKRMFESVREQRLLRKNIPYLLKPMEILVPCYGVLKKSKYYIGLGLYLYEALTFWRNFGVQNSLKLSSPKFLSKEEVLKEVPSLNKENLKGAAVFSDCQITNCDRLTYSVVKSAKEAGAEILSYTEFISLGKEKGGQNYAVLQDKLTKEKIQLKFKILINTSGPWLSAVSKRAGLKKETESYFSKGLQLTFKDKLSSYALALESGHIDPAAKMSRGGRSYFIVPWRDRTLAGTFDINETEAESSSFSDSDISSFKDELGKLYPKIRKSSLLNAFGGLRPVDREFLKLNEKSVEENSNNLALPVSRDHKIIEEADNIISVEGVKYTTFRALAEEVIDLVFKKLGKSEVHSKTREHELWGSSSFSSQSFSSLKEKLLKYVPENVAERIISDFGFSAENLIDYLEKDSSLLLSNNLFSKAEIRYVAEKEDCKKLSDVLKRRLPIFSIGYLDKEIAKECSLIMAKVKRWNEDQRDKEVKEVLL